MWVTLFGEHPSDVPDVKHSPPGKGTGFAGTHGRVYAIARGLSHSLAPEKKIILTVGDGDAFGIGLMHLIHAARCNADITVIVNDNLGYQSTGGQFGFTTPQGAKTDSSPYGHVRAETS